MYRRLQVRDQGYESFFSKPVNVRVARVRVRALGNDPKTTLFTK